MSQEDLETKAVVPIALELWRIVRAFEMATRAMPLDVRARYAAQVRYSASRLKQITESLGMSIVEFEGQVFEPNLPAVAMNIDEFTGTSDLVVERTIEPAMVKDAKVIHVGRVYLELKDKKTEEVNNVFGN